jgi:isopenicillin-N N-acyltransferase-like protein
MPKKKTILQKLLKGILYVFSGFVALFLILAIYLFCVAIDYPPKPKDLSSEKLVRNEPSPRFYTIKNNWFRKSKSGLYELYVEGQPFERGVINGKLTKELVVKQEDYFTAQIAKMIPSKFYRSFLKYFIAWFNRDLSKNVTEEYKEEIYGITQSASDKYQYIGSNYQRILNYHGAHDIGHALQGMALVGCTSFGTWDARSQDSTMIIGRNFDFYVNDDFAHDKIVAFYNPAHGYKFMMVTWGGFIGAVSGMNEKGLSITINAAKSTLPTSAATPVSLVAREILQYAKNINEAIQIAKKRKMFVSESLLIGSANDKKAIVIEKTPTTYDVYDPNSNYIVCTNHFQGNHLVHTKENIEQMKNSASFYRYNHLMDLLKNNGKNTVQKTINILRDTKGLNNANVGIGNEKSINQFIAHHSIVFEPQKLKVWVSTSPWQLGEFVCYDLKKVFALKGMKKDQEIIDSSLTIAPDTFLNTQTYKSFVAYRNIVKRVNDNKKVDPDSLIINNPQYYNAYIVAGDYSFKLNQFNKARGYYQHALTKVIATKEEEASVRQKIIKCNKKVGDDINR